MNFNSNSVSLFLSQAIQSVILLFLQTKGESTEPEQACPPLSFEAFRRAWGIKRFVAFCIGRKAACYNMSLCNELFAL